MRLLNSKTVAEIYGYQVKYLQNRWPTLAAEHRIPPPIPGGRLKWREEDVAEHYRKLAVSDNRR